MRIRLMGTDEHGVLYVWRKHFACMFPVLCVHRIAKLEYTEFETFSPRWPATSITHSERLLNFQNPSKYRNKKTWDKQLVKVKLSPKCNLGFYCECIWVKPSCKSIITKRGTFRIYCIFVFWVNLIFSATWNTDCSITRVSTHEHEHWERCLCTQSLLKRMFLNNSP